MTRMRWAPPPSSHRAQCACCHRVLPVPLGNLPAPLSPCLVRVLPSCTPVPPGNSSPPSLTVPRARAATAYCPYWVVMKGVRVESSMLSTSP